MSVIFGGLIAALVTFIMNHQYNAHRDKSAKAWDLLHAIREEQTACSILMQACIQVVTRKAEFETAYNHVMKMNGGKGRSGSELFGLVNIMFTEIKTEYTSFVNAAQEIKEFSDDLADQGLVVATEARTIKLHSSLKDMNLSSRKIMEFAVQRAAAPYGPRWLHRGIQHCKLSVKSRFSHLLKTHCKTGPKC